MNPLSLWMHLRDKRPPWGEKYAVGVDVAAGTGATNSVASVADQRTGEKVAEFATPHLSPEAFAEAVVELCRFFNDAYLIWEGNGPGAQFGKRVVELGYLNVYYRQNEESLSRKQSDTPGWTATDQNKRVVYGQYATALGTGRFVNRSKPALEECRLITFTQEGKIVNSRARAFADPSGARENHADRPTADALACKGLFELGPKPAPEKPKEEPDHTSLLGRRMMREEASTKAGEW
jgi:hypothetical protein